MLPHLMHSLLWQKSLLLLVPASIWMAYFVGAKCSTREYTAALFAFIWQFQSALILNILLMQQGIWFFTINHSLFYGVPVELLLGQAVLLGAVNFIWLGRKSIILQSLFAAVFLFLIYKCSAIVTSTSLWWLGIIVMMLLSVIPSLLLAAWTATDQRIYLRSLLQNSCWACLLLWLFPSMVLENTENSWSVLLSREPLSNLLFLLPLCIPSAILLSALKEFAVKGEGTPFPYDPPKYLVTTGVYAYLSNPMQLGICLIVGWWGIVIGSLIVTCSALVAVVLFIVFKDICNGSCAIGENNPVWNRYQQEVPKWIPRLTPWQR